MIYSVFYVWIEMYLVACSYTRLQLVAYLEQFDDLVS
jgi:hypothetical protein